MMNGNTAALLIRDNLSQANILLALAAMGLFMISVTAQAAGEKLPYTFVKNTKAVAEEVNQNFEALESAIVANENSLTEKLDKSDADNRFQQFEVELDGKADTTEMNNIQEKLDQKLGLIASFGYQKTPTVRGVTISNVRINGGAIVSPVAPGSSIEVAMDYHIVDAGCPGCIDEIEVGFSHSAPAGCVFQGIPGTTGISGSGKITLTAPSERGVYFIGVDRAQAFNCPAGWWNGAPSSFNRYIAVITVQ